MQRRGPEPKKVHNLWKLKKKTEAPFKASRRNQYC
jgi:hypothetical protein